MIKVETVTIRNKGFHRTYSDEGYFIEREGEFYEEAFDPVDIPREYTETDQLIEQEESEEETE